MNAMNTFRARVRAEYPLVRISTKMVPLAECRRLSAPLLSVTGPVTEADMLRINGWAVTAGIIPDRSEKS